jgi:ribosomal protein L30E
VISDVLFDAVAEIDAYLKSPVYTGVYQGETREAIEALREAMARMVLVLDDVPTRLLI